MYIVQVAETECPLCRSSSETVDHLFLHCSWSWEVWSGCMQWWGVNSCPNNLIKDWIEGWNGLCPSMNRKGVWNILFFTVVWTIWEARNDLVFKAKEANISLSMDWVKFRVAWWFKTHGCGSEDALTLLLLDIKERCVDKDHKNKSRSGVWDPPVDDELLFNVDGAAKGNPGMSGVGGVLRDARGRILCLFSLFLGFRDSNSAEILAIHKACQLIASKPSLADRTVTLKLLLHGPRGSNSFADSLAKAGSRRQGDRIEWGDL
ncbi:hypothetical protein Dsin_009442 [Dipteronia sinensis]|uniref:RNase H type-1 domain-containing protein n=1 Tax=Dipteronia sinensis TaxID=43782 RepID=A0AAE0ARU0_9ROSI|nr:hypothetical protein Dsin_009442 [Dipteronia sinensis]